MNNNVRGIIAGLIATVVLSVLMFVKGIMGAGLFAMNMGMMAAVATPILHLIFGLVLGLSYDKIGANKGGASAVW